MEAGAKEVTPQAAYCLAMEIDLKQSFEDDDDIGLGTPALPEGEDDMAFEGDVVADDLTGYGLEDENGEAITEDYSDSFDADEDEI